MVLGESVLISLASINFIRVGFCDSEIALPVINESESDFYLRRVKVIEKFTYVIESESIPEMPIVKRRIVDGDVFVNLNLDAGKREDILVQYFFPSLSHSTILNIYFVSKVK